jgi:hypothetical protein
MCKQVLILAGLVLCSALVRADDDVIVINSESLNSSTSGYAGPAADNSRDYSPNVMKGTSSERINIPSDKKSDIVAQYRDGKMSVHAARRQLSALLLEEFGGEDGIRKRAQDQIEILKISIERQKAIVNKPGSQIDDMVDMMLGIYKRN